MTIAEFLLARIAEDEADAREAAQEVGWEGWERWARETYAPRVLAECEAKRQIVEEHAELTKFDYGHAGGAWTTTGKCRTCAENEDCDYEGTPMVAWPCPTLCTLASLYADHPDFDPAWRAV